MIMQTLGSVLVAVVAALHIWFLILEMFLWRKPLGLKTFRMSPQKAETTAVLAANQGLYNGFLAAGLITSLILANPAQTQLFQVFFLGCVVIAGLYGAWSVSRGILFVQALPAGLALGFVLL